MTDHKAEHVAVLRELRDAPIDAYYVPTKAERAALDAAIAALTAAPAASEGEDVRLWDSQWVNVVNHANCYEDFTKEEAVAHAVKMTEQYMRANITAGFPNTRPAAQASEGEDGAVAEYQVRPRSFPPGEGWRSVSRREFDDYGEFPGFHGADWERRKLYTRPAAQVAATPKHDEGRDASLAIRTLARDIQHAIADDGYAPQSPADYNGMRESIIRAIATQPAARRVTDEDEDGMPVGYARWYNRRFRGQTVDTQRDALCEETWRAALESFAQPAEGVSGG